MNKIVALAVLLLSLDSFSLETDQYMTWDIELKNSKPFVNRYIDDNINKVLKELNAKSKNYKCEKVAKKILSWNGRSTDFLSVIEKTMYEHPEVDRWPAIDVSERGVVEESIYADVDYFKHKVFGVNVQLDGIYMGTDKLGHFVTVGLSYYKKYLTAKKWGANKEKAIKRAVRLGIFSERTYYGSMISGVFSFADLESNYQGLKFAIELCEGDKPLLVQDQNKNWSLRSPFDITPYLNPKWDESFYPSTYTKKRWKQVKPKLMKYCDQRFEAHAMQRSAYYRKIDKDTLSSIYLDELIKKGRLKDQSKYRLESICPQN